MRWESRLYPQISQGEHHDFLDWEYVGDQYKQELVDPAVVLHHRQVLFDQWTRLWNYQELLPQLHPDWRLFFQFYHSTLWWLLLPLSGFSRKTRISCVMDQLSGSWIVDDDDGSVSAHRSWFWSQLWGLATDLKESLQWTLLLRMEITHTCLSSRYKYSWRMES